MTSCANCSNRFIKKPDNKGYHRFGLEFILSGTDTTVREHLETLTGATYTPHKKSVEQFLCPDCYNNLRNATKYKQSLDKFFGATDSSSYIFRKRSVSASGESFFVASASTSYASDKRSLSDLEDSPHITFKRPRVTSTPLKPCKAVKSIFSKSSSKWETIISAVRARKYRRAINNLCNATSASRRHFNDLVAQKVRSEVKHLLDLSPDSFPLNDNVDLRSIGEFSWEKTLNSASKHAPVLYSALVGAVTTRQNKETLSRGANVNLKPRIGSALAVLLHTRSPQKCNFLQTVFSIQLWRGRLKRETIQQLSRLAICAGYDRTLKSLDNIRVNFDKAAVRLKENIEQAVTTRAQFTINENDAADLSIALSEGVPNIEDTILYSDDGGSDVSELEVTNSDSDGSDSSDSDILMNINISDDESESDEEKEEEENVNTSFDKEAEVSAHDVGVTDIPFGFTMCWDNVGKKVIRRPTEHVKNKYLNMALGYMAINRVNAIDAISYCDTSAINASEIPIAKFVPDSSDAQELRYRMGVIVGRIIVRHLKWFQDYFYDNVTHHIVHEHSLRSSQKSVLINLGVFDENPSSTLGAIGIYEKLQKYIPVIDGRPSTAIVYGDGLSCERGNDARKARANGLNPLERLEGLEPGAQEFHKEMLLLQDFYDVFFKGNSASERGTLSQLKNIFNFRQVKGDIADNFSHAWELMSVTVEGYVCLLLMEMYNMSDPIATPESAPHDIQDMSKDDRQTYFDNICSNIVDKVWQNVDTDTLIKGGDGQGDTICCGEELDDEIICCNKLSSCIRGEYFHHSCVGVNIEEIIYPWYCSDECKNKPTEAYKYCICKTDLGTDIPMIGCDGEPVCQRFEWYHMRCLSINPLKPPKGKWYCSIQCKGKGKGSKTVPKSRHASLPDHKNKYNIAMLWYGLNLLARRDANREADGRAMLSHWKYDLIHFFSHKHPKYLILAHRLLAAVNGWLPERLRGDLIHNRTVNYSGGIGRNLPMDFMNEIMNRLFKDLLQSAKGRYTDLTIQRCSQLIGPLGEALDRVFEVNVVQQEVYRHRYRDVNRDENVSRLVQFLYDENMFKQIPGRSYRAFPNFEFSVNPKRPESFATKLNQLSKRLDVLKRVVLDA